jgi:hypothetical protein
MTRTCSITSPRSIDPIMRVIRAIRVIRVIRAIRVIRVIRVFRVIRVSPIPRASVAFTSHQTDVCRCHPVAAGRAGPGLYLCTMILQHTNIGLVFDV